MKINRADQDLILVHAFWGFFTAFCLSATTLPLGWRIFMAVVGYHIILPLFARQVKYTGWLQLWQFLLILSILQVFPDWYLSNILGVLRFPDTGSPAIGGVPLFMAGMWTIPLFVVVYLGRRIQGKATFWLVSLATGLLFIGSEAILPSLPIWQAINVTKFGEVAVYIALPEILLGITTLRAFEWSLNQSLGKKFIAALAVMLIYVVNATICYFLVEKIIFRN
jgi:hypothetical protein